MKELASFSTKVSAAVDVGAIEFRRGGISLRLLIERSCNNVQSDCYLILTKTELKLGLVMLGNFSMA